MNSQHVNVALQLVGVLIMNLTALSLVWAATKLGRPVVEDPSVSWAPGPAGSRIFRLIPAAALLGMAALLLLTTVGIVTRLGVGPAQ